MSPGPLITPLGPFQIFSKIRGDFGEWLFISGVNDTAIKEKIFFSYAFFYILLRAYLSPLYTCRLNFCLVLILRPWQAGIVSTVLSPVSLTAISPAAAVGRGCLWCHWNHQKKTHQKTHHTLWLEAPEAAKTLLNPNERNLQTPKSDTAANSFIRNPMKRHVHRHPTHPNHRRCCQRQ